MRVLARRKEGRKERKKIYGRHDLWAPPFLMIPIGLVWLAGRQIGNGALVLRDGLCVVTSEQTRIVDLGQKNNNNNTCFK